MPSVATWIAIVAGAVAAFFLVAGFAALRRARIVRMVTRFTMALLLLAVAGLFGLLSVALRGYQALTREEVAAVVRTEPAGPQRFRANFRFPDGREATFTLAGDELYVDAHILKWKPVANFLGLHTAYELDRVAGRYLRLDDERQAPRTVHPLAPDRPVDLFELRRRHAMLAPLLDAEYGSASYVPAEQAQTLEVRVSTTGLLIRKVEGDIP
jgi:hypothetical protein